MKGGNALTLTRTSLMRKLLFSFLFVKRELEIEKGGERIKIGSDESGRGTSRGLLRAHRDFRDSQLLQS